MGLVHSQKQLAQVSVRQLLLAPLNVTPIFDGRDVGPLVAVTDGATALIIVTGCVDGPAEVTVEVLDGAAAEPAAIWEACEEVDLLMDSAMYLSSPTWAELHDPVIPSGGSGRYRFRVSARGRAAHAGLSTPDTAESYLIQAWPADSVTERRLVRDDGVSL